MAPFNGGCLCGNVRYSYDAEPISKAICHCDDCKKISGSNYSLSFIVPSSSFVVTAGHPNVFSKTADSGVNIDNYLCGICGTTLWRETDNYKNLVIIKAGTLDEAHSIISAGIPAAEVFIRSRVAWVQPIHGAEQRVEG
ncbi:hypothetical protein TgHK011_004927 [Trichoderma gracile]|nr:hypothetical protein TgHK011_004927 [Trichoderma gracile]